MAPRTTTRKKNRDSGIWLRVSVEEKEKFEKLAADRHTTLSEIVRQALHKEAEKQVAA